MDMLDEADVRPRVAAPSPPLSYRPPRISSSSRHSAHHSPAPLRLLEHVSRLHTQDAELTRCTPPPPGRPWMVPSSPSMS